VYRRTARVKIDNGLRVLGRCFSAHRVQFNSGLDIAELEVT